jgi:hydroxymethylpyrimidine pyrophosphatase-like HAD family hydrolase
MILTFDLDNTITPHKKPISNSMYFLLKKLNTTHRVWIVTASTARLARQQLGPLFNEVERVYCCSGAERWEGGKLIEFKEWLPANPRQVVTSLN